MKTQGLVQSLGLAYGPAGTPLPGSQVYLFKFPNDQYRLPGGVQFPCVQVCLGGREVMERGDFEDTVIRYPVLVAHIFASDHALGLNNDELYWRQAITDTFLDLPRPEVTTADVFDCHIDPEPPIDLSLFQGQNLDVGGLLLNFFATRRRPGR